MIEYPPISDISPDPPNYPDPTDCGDCNGTGQTCEYCGEPMPHPEGDWPFPSVCECPPIPDDVDVAVLSQMELLGYTSSWQRRSEPCKKCSGEGVL